MEVWRSATSQRKTVQRITVNVGFSRHPSTPPTPRTKSCDVSKGINLKEILRTQSERGKSFGSTFNHISFNYNVGHTPTSQTILPR